MDVRYPIGTLQIPETITTEHIQDWLKGIQEFPSSLNEIVGALDEESLSKTYRDNSWTVLQLVHHIADAQVNLYQRIKLALTTDNPKVSPYDEVQWAMLPDYGLPVHSSIKLLEGINEKLVRLIESLDENQLERAFIHATDGKITVAETVAKCDWHPKHHLAHIKLALSK